MVYAYMFANADQFHGFTRSSNFSPSDFDLWVLLKELVYTTDIPAEDLNDKNLKFWCPDNAQAT